MKVLMVEPGKSPYETEIEGGLESLQAAIGGDIQATYPFEDPVGVICNDEGKLIGLPLNRAIYDDEGHLYDIVPGNFLIVGLGEEDFTDLPADLMERRSSRRRTRKTRRTPMRGTSRQRMRASSPRSSPSRRRKRKNRPLSWRNRTGMTQGLTTPQIWLLTWMNFSGRTAGPTQTCTRIPMQKRNVWRTSCFQEIPEKSA